MVERLARFLVRRSRLVVGIWVVAVAVLALQGRDLERELTIHPIYVDGSASKRAHEIAVRQFGSNDSMIVMLRGPERAVEAQGRRLARRLGAVAGMQVISPWAHGATVEGLRPEPGVAALVVRVEGSEKDEVLGVLPPVRRQIDENVEAPVHASVAGFPAIVESFRSANEEATRTGELIAVPVLLLVLFLVFRSVLAAILPVVIGGAVVAATKGVLSFLLGLVELDLFALGAVSMMGLALGVDYSLLVVSRFREAHRDGGDVAEAVQQTTVATARSVIPAGCGLLLAMLVAVFLLPGSTVNSVAIAVIAATVLSMVSAICVVPALLTLLGSNLDRWSLSRRQGQGIVPLGWSRRLANRPRAVVLIMLVLVFFAGWALTLKTGSASVAMLPPNDSGRLQQEDVQEALGSGWIAPMEVLVNGRGKPVTSPERLRALADFQRHLERDPGVQTMAGFAQIERGARRLRGIEGTLAASQRGLGRLESGISRARDGAALTSGGLLKAAQGSGALGSGIAAAGTGAGALANGLQKTSDGSQQLTRGLGRADQGSGRLAQGTTKASTGAGRLADGLERAREQTDDVVGSTRLFKNAMRSGDDRLEELHIPLRTTEERLASALEALQRMTTGRSDAEYAAALRAVEEAVSNLTGTNPSSGEQPDPSFAGVSEGVKRAEGQFGVGLYLASRSEKNGQKAIEGMKKLSEASERLDRGLRKLSAGSQQVSDGIGELLRGGETLSPALARLSEGAGYLVTGLGQLQTGADGLSAGLAGGAQKSKLLTAGLGRIGAGLERQSDPDGTDPQIDQLQQQSPGLFRSAYFVLAGFDGSSPERRDQIGFLIDLDRGGSSARMLVIPRDEPVSAGARETKDRIEGEAAALARRTGTEVVVGGIAPAEIDVNDALRGQALLMRILLSLVSLVVLIPVLRSLTIPLFAALINLIAVSASFGAISLLFNHSLLGGPGYVEALTIPAAMMVMFGLAIDYEVFVFARIREEYVRTGSTSAAIRNGLGHTAHVVTGAATIMIAVFLAFSVSEFMAVRSFGVALAIAVAVDAFIVRLIVIPAVMGRLGKWCWWLPAWLDRILPGGGPMIPAETEAQGASRPAP